MDFHVFSLNYTKSRAGRREELCLCWRIHKTSLSPSGPGPAEGMRQAPARFQASLQRGWESRSRPSGGEGWQGAG